MFAPLLLVFDMSIDTKWSVDLMQMGLFAKVRDGFFKTPLSDEFESAVELVVRKILKKPSLTLANGRFLFLILGAWIQI